MIELVERGNIKDPAVVRALEYIIARLKGLLTQTFDQDGQLIVANPNLAVFNVGDIKPSTRAADHAGFLLCDGRQVSRVKYNDLFRIVGTAYGAGDGTTSFQLPNYQGRFLLGKATAGTGSTLGATGGALDHVHSVGSHTHTISADGTHTHGGSTGAGGGHDHSVSGTTDGGNSQGPYDTNFDGANANAATPGHGHNIFGVTSSSDNHTHAIDVVGNHSHGGATGSASGGDSGAANPAYAVVNYFVFSGVSA